MMADHGKSSRISVTCGALVLALTIGCSDTYVQVPVNPTPVPYPTPGTGGIPVPVVQTKIEFRAIGNPTSVRLRYSTPADGLVQVISALPYTGGFSTTAESVFLSLEGSPLSYSTNPYPFFGVQIIVNGSVFREATAADFLFQTLAVSGTWRR